MTEFYGTGGDPVAGPPPHTQPQGQAQGSGQEPSLGQLVGEVAADLQKLLRQEVELAKVELKAEAVKTGKAAAMLGGAGFAAYMVAVLGSLAVLYGLANVMNTGWAALVVTLVWAVVGAVLFALGRGRLRQVSPKPEQTIQTLKEDAQWARHPTS